MDKKVITLLKNQCFIDGKWVGKPEIPVTNPATGEEIAKVPRSGTAETKQAIDAAEKAFKTWSKLLAKERSAILRKWFDLQIAHADELALLLTSEQGKPLAEARGEIIYGASFTEFYAEEAKRIYGETIPTFKQGTPHHRHQAAARRHRRDHAVELPARDDHAEGVAGAGRRLHGRRASRRPRRR